MTNQTTPQPPKPRGRPRKLPNLKNPIKVLVVDRPSGWIGHAEVEATNLKPLSACRDEASIQRIIELFSRDGYVIQEIKDEVQS